jgi:hypothetical protein
MLLEALEAVAEKYKLPVLISTHPRTRKKLQGHKALSNPLLTFHDPFGFLDYVKLQANARMVLSDSGTISEESAMMGFPAISIRTSTERPEAIDSGTIVLGGISKQEVLNAVEEKEVVQPRGPALAAAAPKEFEAIELTFPKRGTFLAVPRFEKGSTLPVKYDLHRTGKLPTSENRVGSASVVQEGEKAGLPSKPFVFSE